MKYRRLKGAIALPCAEAHRRRYTIANQPPLKIHNFNRVAELGPLDRLPVVDTSGLCIVNRYYSWIIV